MKQYLLSLSFLASVLVASASEPTTYIVAPGSTVTLYVGGTPVGQPEALTGGFEWVEVSDTPDAILYMITSLDFQSTSFAIQLDGSLTNTLGCAVFTGSDEMSFGTVVDAPAFLSGPAEVISAFSESSYAGPPDSPTVLQLPDLHLIAMGPDQGSYLALNITAMAMDTDGDGVPDNVDQCPNTPAGAGVDPNGCSIDQLVPCAGPWKNRHEYQVAFQNMADAFVAAGYITLQQSRAAVRAAKRLDCGKR